MPSIDNKKKSQQNKIAYIFLTAFFVSLVVIIYLATAFTPDIDVDINSSENGYATEDKHQDIDSRLRELQQDELIGAQKNNTESSSEIIDQLKKLKEETIAKQQKKDEEALDSTNDAETTKLNSANSSYKKSNPVQMQSAKVYVGRYATFDEAIKVQDALVQSSLASSPFIKNMGGYYVVQIGSYTNQQTAQNIAEGLIEHGYSARMVLE